MQPENKNLVKLDINLVSEPEIFDHYDTLSVSGGGVKGFCILGSLQYLHDNKYIDKVKNYIGTSVGTILLYLLIIGYSPIEIIAYICTHKITEKLSNFDISKALLGEGAVSFLPIQDQLERMTINKIGTLFTFKEFYNKFQKNLVCVTYNITKSKIEYINYENYPDLPILTAIRMSCSLPFVFEDYFYRGDQYVDGGIADNFPMKYSESIGKHIIGINIHTEQKTKNRNEMNILEYIYQILMIPVKENNNSKKVTSIKHKIIDLKVYNLKPFNFSLTTAQKLDLFSSGYQQSSEQI